MVLGGSWAPFEHGLGRSGASFGRSWVLLGDLLGLQNRTFIKHWSKMGSKMTFGLILEGFGKGLGRVWGGFGWVLGGFGLSKLKLLRHMVLS